MRGENFPSLLFSFIKFVRQRDNRSVVVDPRHQNDQIKLTVSELRNRIYVASTSRVKVNCEKSSLRLKSKTLRKTLFPAKSEK